MNNLTSPSFPNGIEPLRSEAEVRAARLTMADVINRGARPSENVDADLLAVVKDMAAFVKHWQADGLCNLKPTPESLATAAERLRAAIAKATGAP